MDRRRGAGGARPGAPSQPGLPGGAGVTGRFAPAPPLRGRLRPPADKSISHRAALIAAMASEPVRVTNYLHAADTDSTLAAVRELGALVEERPGELLIRGTGLRNAQVPASAIDVCNAG